MLDIGLDFVVIGRFELFFACIDRLSGTLFRNGRLCVRVLVVMFLRLNRRVLRL